MDSGGDASRETLGGIVISLRNEPPRPFPGQPSAPPAWELGPISPELALIDPELRRAALAQLPDLPCATPVDDQPGVVVHLPTALEPRPELTPPRRHARLRVLSSAAWLVALGLLLTLLVGREGRSTTRQPTPPAAAALARAVVPTADARSEPAAPAKQTKAAGALHAPALPGQTFAWVAEPKALAYEFQLFQRGERVFRARVTKPRLELPGRWRQNGRPHALVPGTYRWYVWPVSSRTKRQSTVAVVQARLVIE